MMLQVNDASYNRQSNYTWESLMQNKSGFLSSEELHFRGFRGFRGFLKTGPKSLISG